MAVSASSWSTLYLFHPLERLMISPNFVSEEMERVIMAFTTLLITQMQTRILFPQLASFRSMV